MDQLLRIVDALLGLGPAVLMPVIITVLGLAFGQKFSRALRSGFIVGIGFIGIDLVVGLLSNALSDASQAMVERFGLQLTVIDMGWPVNAAITWALPLSAVIIPLALGINVLLLMTRMTKTMNINIWNYWHFAYATALVVAVTNSPVLGLVIGGTVSIIYLKIADWSAPWFQKEFDLPGLSCTTGSLVSWAPIGFLLDKLVGKIPFIKDLKATPGSIQEKFGVLGEPMVMGIVLGGLIGVLAGFSWDAVLGLAVRMGAVMVILPRMVKMLMEGLIPISESAKKLLGEKFNRSDIYIGMDTALAIGHPTVISTGLIMIPITLLLAVILPGNKVLPFVDLAALPFYMVFIVAFCRGNIIRGVINGTIAMAAILYLATYVAPFTNSLAVSAGYSLPDGAALVSSLSAGAHWIETVFAVILRFFTGG